jgi:hypothetical protein
MASNNTTFPSPSATPWVSPAPSVNGTLVNVTRNEPLLWSFNDPAFPTQMVQWTAILCLSLLFCAGSAQSLIAFVVQVLVNLVLRFLRAGA